MRIQILQKKFITVLVFILMCICALAETKTVTYTVTSTSSVSVTGDAPVGSIAEYSSTYKTEKCKLTSGNSMTLTLSGYKGKVIKELKLSVKSNSSGGAGSMTCTIGSNQVASIENSAFNTANWHGSWSSTSYVDVIRSIRNVDVKTDEKIIIQINATANSIFCQSFTICYWDDELDDVTSIDISGDYPRMFTLHDSFSCEGMSVIATDINSKQSDVTEVVMFTGHNMDEVGEHTVTVAYKGKTFTYKINVFQSNYTKDTLTKGLFELTSTNNTQFSSKKDNEGSDAVYAGFAAKEMDMIAFKNESSYIVTTETGGLVKYISVNWVTNEAYKTSSGRYLSVYGKNEPYNTTGTDDDGVLLGQLVCDVPYSYSTSLSVSGDYRYVKIIANGALYMRDIDIEWLAPYTRCVSSGSIGTICLPYDVKKNEISGADFLKIAGKDSETPSCVYFDEVDDLQAGVPYIFFASSDRLSLGMSGDRAFSAGQNNGLYGVFEDYSFTSISEGDQYYIINSNNEIQRASNESGVYANRAYIKMDEVPLYEPSSSRERVLVLDENGYSFEEATDISEIISSQKENDVEIYTLGGVKINDLQRGVNIVRMSDGSVKKVLKR